MLKKLILIVVVLAALLATAGPAFAQSGTFYVNTAYTGTELGTMAQPFNTLDEAVAAAQAQYYGAYIYTWVNGAWVYYGFIQGVYPPYTGATISHTALFVLIGLASLILVAAGWFLMRRARALPSGA